MVKGIWVGPECQIRALEILPLAGQYWHVGILLGWACSWRSDGITRTRERCKSWKPKPGLALSPKCSPTLQCALAQTSLPPWQEWRKLAHTPLPCAWGSSLHLFCFPSEDPGRGWGQVAESADLTAKIQILRHSSFRWRWSCCLISFIVSATVLVFKIFFSAFSILRSR